LPVDYAAMVKRHAKGLGLKLVFEIGRMIAGNAGVLITRVLYVKQGLEKTFIVVDAAMNDLVRPTLYEAYHEVRPLRAPRPGAEWIVADVVGPICESGDYLALDRKLPAAAAGDLLAIMTAGAYGAVQSGTYNTRALVPEVLVRETEAAIVRPRIEVDAVIALDRMAPWLNR
jgi:diaminopimelate decarboxylase